MKRSIIFFLPFLVMLGAGCLKNSNDTNANNFPVPSGTFAGQFTRLRYNATKKGYDTLKANLTLAMDIGTGYSITGDTTLHAGSKGGFTIDPNNILFTDNTLVPNVTPAKIHLSGLYLYGYDGTNLQIQATFADTLGFFYSLKKQ